MKLSFIFEVNQMERPSLIKCYRHGYPCLFWMARWNHGLGLTPNFGITGYKAPYLLYYGGSKESENDMIGETEPRERRSKWKEGTGKVGKNEGSIGDRQLTLGGGVVTVGRRAIFLWYCK